MNKRFIGRLATIPAVVMCSAGSAYAALPVGITAAIDAASDDGVSLTGAIAVGLAAFVLLAKAFGKFGLR